MQTNIVSVYLRLLALICIYFRSFIIVLNSNKSSYIQIYAYYLGTISITI